MLQGELTAARERAESEVETARQTERSAREEAAVAKKLEDEAQAARAAEEEKQQVWT